MTANKKLRGVKGSRGQGSILFPFSRTLGLSDSRTLEPLRKGYSLIELMVVMSVLTLLIAMGIPTYNGVISKNRVKLSKGVGGTFQSALEMYKATNDGYPATSAMDTMDKLYTVLSPYLADDPRNSLHATQPFLSYASSGSPNPTTYTLSVRSRTSEFIPVTATPKSLSAIYAGEEVPYP